jgi:hypothetical protein
MSGTDGIRELYDDEVLCHFAQVRERDVVFQPSFPILFFGNFECYLRSRVRVVTVGLNPSWREFETGCKLREVATSTSMDRFASMVKYFEHPHYKSWFGSFENVLKGLGATYYTDCENIAIHTDMCSPVATRPTWSRLGNRREFLREKGLAIWNSLIRLLEPQIVIACVKPKYREQISFHVVPRTQPTWSWSSTLKMNREPRKTPYVPETDWREIRLSTRSLFVFGNSCNVPFGSISDS